MAATHGKDVDIYIGGYDLTGYFNDMSITRDADTAETTTFGSTSKSYVVGLKDGSYSFAGIWDGTANAVDDRLAATFGVEGTVVTTYPGGDTQENPAYVAAGIQTSYEVGASIGDAVTVSAEVQASGGLFRGLAIHAKAAETATGDDATSADFGAASTSSTGFVANLHGFAFSGTSCTVKLIDSADDATFADVTGGGFTAISGVTSQQLTHASTSVRRYVKTNRAGVFTSCTYAVALAKK
jgi:hypothetical protein